MEVLGIDPSLVCTGFAILGADSLVTLTAETSPKSDLEERLMEIRQRLVSLISAYPAIGMVAIEQPIAYRSGVTTINLGMLHGVLRVTAYDLGLFIVTVNLATVKKRATGNGKASKEEMVEAAKLKWGLDLTSDEADAAFIALCGREMIEE